MGGKYNGVTPQSKTMGGKYYWDEVIVYRLYLTLSARLTQYIVILIDLKVVNEMGGEKSIILLIWQTQYQLDHSWCRCPQ